MHPILLKVGSVTLYSYGAMLVIAFLVATGLAGRSVRRQPPALAAISAEQLVDFACLSLLGGILGARLFYVLLQWDLFLHDPWEIPAIWHGGLVWYGGLLGGLLAGWCYARAHGLVFLRVMDQVAPFLALGHAIGRVGCFLNGCCYGKPTTAWCGVVFPGQGVKVYPTQLFESAGLLFLYIVLRGLQRPAPPARPRFVPGRAALVTGGPGPGMLARPGRLFGLYLVSYAGLRFFIEGFRGDQAIWWAGLTLQQLISVGVMGVGACLLFRVSRFAFRVSSRETRNSKHET